MAGRIRDSDIAAVRDRNSIDEVVGEYVALRRAGAGSLKGLCPFHDEKTPSFNVRPTHGTFHCFGCGEGGSVIDFVMRMEHVGFVEAVERLADRVGFRLTYTGGGASVQRDRGTRSRLLEANRQAAAFYAEQLRTAEARPARGVPGHPRIRRRGRPALRLRVRAHGLGRADQAPAGRRFHPRRAVQGRAVEGGPARARSTGSAGGCCGRSTSSAATWSASAPGGCSTTTRSRPST